MLKLLNSLSRDLLLDSKKVSSNVAVFMAIVTIGKVMGILRDRQQAIHFGAHTAESIAFAQASVLPRTILEIMFSAAFSASLIPVFVTRMEQKGKEAAYNLAALFMFFVAAFTILFSAIGVLFAYPLFHLSLGNAELPYGTIVLGANLLRIMFPMMIFSGFAFSFASILQALGEFRITAAMSLVSNGIVLVYYFFFLERFGIYGLAVSFLIGFAAQGLIQIPFLAKHKFRFRLKLDIKDPGLRQIWHLTLPALAASWIVPVNVLVNARAAAQLYGGQYGLNAIYYAHSLYAIISGVFIFAVANVVFPKLVRLGANDNKAGYSSTLLATVKAVFFALIPLTALVVALSRQIVGLIFGGGLFGERAVEITSTALAFYAPGIVGYGLMMILCRACFALHDGKTPFLSAVIAIFVNGALSFLLAPFMLVAGPALANAAGSSVGAIMLLGVLSKKSVLPFSERLLVDILKMLAAGGLVFVAVRFVGGFLHDFGAVVQLFVPAAVGCLVYLACTLVLKLDEAQWVKRKLLYSRLKSE